jgi:hypothetical protein
MTVDTNGAGLLRDWVGGSAVVSGARSAVPTVGDLLG